MSDLSYLERLTSKLCSREHTYKRRCKAYESFLDELMELLDGSSDPKLVQISLLVEKHKLRESENE